jgi:hypothetical protein
MLIAVTLLAVACGYVGWQAKIVRERKAMIERVHNGLNGLCETVNKYLSLGASLHFDPQLTEDQTPTVSWIRQWLGDEPVVLVLLPETVSQSDAEEIFRLFPEAEHERAPPAELLSRLIRRAKHVRAPLNAPNTQ